MTKIKAGAAALAVALMPGAAQAQTTMQMMEWCKPVVDSVHVSDTETQMVSSFEGGRCLGAFTSLFKLSYIYLYRADGHNERYNQSESTLGACPPNGVNVVQMVRIFDADARKHPEAQHLGFEWVALSALKQAFPCK